MITTACIHATILKDYWHLIGLVARSARGIEGITFTIFFVLHLERIQVPSWLIRLLHCLRGPKDKNIFSITNRFLIFNKPSIFI